MDWSTWGAPQPYFGMFSLLFGFVTVPCYLFCTRIIWTMRRLTCYNLMFLLAVSDICSLIAGTLICGILLIKGEVYCRHPRLHFLLAAYVMFFFVLSCTICLILALNRVLDLLSTSAYEALFK
ncbi:hypothetical protein PFISCL1PPCAC_29163, partial [Pristionchus fissidentatus]